MRPLLLAASLLSVAPSAAVAQEEGGKVNLLSPSGGLMLWTLIIFAVLLWILARFAFKPMLAAVEAREKSLQAALDKARTDREEAEQVLAEHRRQLEAARNEAQRLIVEGRATAEQLRSELLEQTHAQQQEMLERARRDIETEKEKAIHALRREAVDLALAGAGKVIERNLDSDANRRLVETYLASLNIREPS
jgi:F-type H+-transporting ATPase subunit b